MGVGRDGASGPGDCVAGNAGADGGELPHEDEQPSRAEEQPEQPQDKARSRPRGRRRVTQAAPEGSDPHPFDPPEAPRSTGENDDRLKADKPPHWG